MFDNSSNASLNDLSNLMATNIGNPYIPELDGKFSGSSKISLPQTLYFQGGDDVIKLGNGNKTVYAGEGNNSIFTASGNDFIYAGSGRDIIDAGNGNNTIYAGEGINLITSGRGNDLIYSGSSNDFINAGDGRNTIFTGEGSNRVLSGKGNDLIVAGGGNDIIYSGAGNDTIYAGEGNNIINAGTGNDQVFIGSGKDKIILEAGQGSATIFGFDVTKDKLRLGESLLGKSLKFVSQGSDTLVKAGNDLLATLKGVAKGSQALIDNGPLYRYTAIDLGNPATTAQTVTVSAINDFGEVSGRYTRDGLFEYTNPTTGQPASRTVVQPFIWKDGTLTDLTRTGTKIGSSNFGAADGETVTLFGGGGFVNAIGNSGVIVGAADEVPGRGTDRGTYWKPTANGYELSIYDFGGVESYFFDINNQNQIAGRNIDAPGHDRPLYWENGVTQALADLGGNGGTARGINNKGQIVGYVDSDGVLDSKTTNTAILWEKDALGVYQLKDLGTFGAEQATLRDINDRGQIIGASSSSSGSTATSTPFLLRNEDFTALGSLGGNTGSTNGINEFTQVVGASQIAGGTNHAYVWNEGVMSDLNNLITTPLTYNGATVTLNNAVSINNFGDIVATGTYIYKDATGKDQTGTRSYVLKASF